MTQERVLRSWKQIAQFLNCEVRTVQRWESLRGLPVHRTPGASRAPVYAFADELFSWMHAAGPKQKTAARTLFFQAFMKAPEPMWFLDDHRRYCEVNEAACEMLGVERSALLKNKVDAFAHESELAGINALWRRFMESETLRGEFRFMSLRGEIVITSYAARARIIPGLHLAVLRETRRVVGRPGEHLTLDTRTVTELTHDLRNALFIIRDSDYLPAHIRGRAVSESVKQIEEGLNSLFPRLEQRRSDAGFRTTEKAKRIV
jgi:PAS domain S-box-containing protein